MLWVLFASLAAFGDALVGFFDKKLLNEIQRNQEAVDSSGVLFLFSALFGFITAAFVFLIIIICGNTSILLIPQQAWLLSLAAGCLEMLWMLPYFYALDRGGVLNSVPLFQTIPIFSLVFGLLFFHETPNSVAILGSVVIIVGAVLLNYEPEAKKIDKKNIALMLCSSAIISFGFFIFKDAANIGNFWASVIGNGVGMGISGCMLLLTHSKYRADFRLFLRNINKRITALQFGNESLYTASAVSNQLAITAGPSIMAVSSLNALHPVFTLGINFFLLQKHPQEEGVKLQKEIAAILLISLGALLLILN